MAHLLARDVFPTPATGAGLSDPVIDLDHLSRVTLGDRGLEDEVLRLFDRQAAMLLNRMQEASAPAMLAACAHTLKGSARGIGAWNVAKRADGVEAAARLSDASLLPDAIEQLTLSVAEAKAAIADLLRPH